MSKISAYSAITNVQPDDLLVVVDVNDTTMAPTGTTKNMTLSQLGPMQPWQFTPEEYGALGNGRVLGDVVTNATTTITSASANFTAGDVGKYIMIHGANGTTNGPLITTIASVTNLTTAVLASGASASHSALPAVYGTDDTAAIQSCLSAAGTYATTYSSTSPGSGNYFAQVIFGSKIYILGTGPTQSTSPQFNAQLTLPYPNVNGTTPKLVIALTGAGDAGYCQYWEALIPNVAGSALMSMVSAPSTPSGTYGIQSVIGGPSAPGAFTGGYANVKAVVQGVSVWCPIFTNLYAYDFGYVSAMRMQQSSAHIFAPPGVNGSAVQPLLSNISASQFLASIGSGVRTPVNGNNDDIYVTDCTVEGYECAWRPFDHFTGTRIAAIYSDVVMKWDASQGASGVSHEISIEQISAEVYNGGLLTNGSGTNTVQVDISWDAECSGVSYDISDVGNTLRGLFRFRDPADVRFPTVSGAANLKVICDELGPGYWSPANTVLAPPAVPGSGTAATNNSWRDAMVYLASGGGAVSAVAVGTAPTGLTLGTSGAVSYRVTGGATTTLTYASSAPTWKWFLD